MNLFYQSDFSETNPILSEEESQHAIKVLRYKIGDAIQVTNGKGSLFSGEIESIKGKICRIRISETDEYPKAKHYIHIALAPTKSSDRIEWFVEKAIEIGVQKITFLETQNSERSKLNLDKMRKVAIAAMKQSKQFWLPQIEGLLQLEGLMKSPEEQKFIASVSEKDGQHLIQLAKANSSYLVLIGPEGDFSPQELALAIKADFKSVSLGKTTLRTETAGVAACHILNLIQYR